MTYEEAVSYLEDIPRFTEKPGLDHTRILLSEMGNPDRDLKVIHVAGTNGKGSVCAYLESILRESGYRCGLFTSPHLESVNERIQIGRVPVSDGLFLDSFETVMDAAKRQMRKGLAHPTYFEVLFLMALDIFRREKTEVCILETGLGGRLDMTNIVRDPLVTVITSISLDHTQILGDTVEKIAAEKAGIIKPGVPLVFDGSCEASSRVFERRAEQLHSPWEKIAPGDLSLIRQDKNGIGFSFDGDSFWLRTPARYQMMNAALAVRAAKRLGGMGAESAEDIRFSVPGRQKRITEETIRNGLARASWPCRMEIFPDGVILDGAHNEGGMKAFIDTARQIRGEDTITILFGAVADKDYPAMIRDIVREVSPEHVVTVSVGGPRRVSAEELADLFRRAGSSDVTAEENVEKAFRIAYSKKEDGILFCIGSLYLAGAVRKLAAGGEAPENRSRKEAQTGGPRQDRKPRKGNA